MPKENPLLAAIRLLASRRGARLFRNSTGRIKDEDGRWHVFGLCVGSSDLIGFAPVTITPEMVGQTVAVFVAIEAKAGKTATTDEQRAFVRMVNDAGGIAGVVRKEEDAEWLLNLHHAR